MQTERRHDIGLVMAAMSQVGIEGDADAAEVLWLERSKSLGCEWRRLDNMTIGEIGSILSRGRDGSELVSKGGGGQFG